MKFPIIAVVLAAYLHRVFFDLFYCSEEKHHQSDPSQLRMQRTELSVLPPIPSKDKNIFNLTFKHKFCDIWVTFNINPRSEMNSLEYQ